MNGNHDYTDHFAVQVYVPDHLVRNGTHLVREAVFMTAIFFGCYRNSRRRLLDVLGKDSLIRIL